MPGVGMCFHRGLKLLVYVHRYDHYVHTMDIARHYIRLGMAAKNTMIYDLAQGIAVGLDQICLE